MVKPKNEDDTMGGTVRAKVKEGVLRPLDKLDLPEGQEVTVNILAIPGRRDPGGFARAAGTWKGTVDAERLIRDIYADRLISNRSEPLL